MIDIVSRDQLFKRLSNRSTKTEDEVLPSVQQIVKDVRENGDEAVFEYTQRFDGVQLTPASMRVTELEIQEALELIDAGFMDALARAGENIRQYHKKQVAENWELKGEGKIMGQRVLPIERVGLYVPGGTAAYPSTVLMNGIPAQVAQVSELVIVTPPDKEGKVNPYILAAAKYLGIRQIYKVGGAQAVAALAYGTETIPKVDKIVGPGNIFVSTAKGLVYGDVAIDMIAGPSEILVIADKTGNPGFIAADLISQAEHDTLASSILLTTDADLAQEVQREVIRQLDELPKKDIAQESLKNFGAIVVVESLDESMAISNSIAPEHLELMTSDPFGLLEDVKNAGSVFLGHYTPESLGDYYAGPNHVLPTAGSARFSSPLGVYDFVKRSSYLYYSKEALEDCSGDVTLLADSEGLTGHGNAVRVRVNG